MHFHLFAWFLLCFSSFVNCSTYAEDQFNDIDDYRGLVWRKGLSNVSVLAGYETNGRAVYVARALLDPPGLFQPRSVLKAGKYVPGWGIYVGHGGKQVQPAKYQILSNPKGANLKWYKFKKGFIAYAVISGGIDESKDQLYVGRSSHNGDTVVGYAHLGKGTLSYGWYGKEYTTGNFELLLVYEGK